MVDAINRPALARTAANGSGPEVELSASLTPEEVSITLYHEILEAVSVASTHPPADVCESNEAGFEAAVRRMHAEFGLAAPTTLNRMLELFGF